MTNGSEQILAFKFKTINKVNKRSRNIRDNNNNKKIIRKKKIITG